MKLKYQKLSKKEQIQIKDEFLKKEVSLVYKKANKVMIFATLGIILAIISTFFDIVYKTGIANYFLDGFLFIFSLIFFIIMKNTKLKEINKYTINKKK
ncbi:MAG: hypothetical protein PHF21_02160 [Bacilli bacterium]|nr:hypothetical protein [Bacilli bacterium]